MFLNLHELVLSVVLVDGGPVVVGERSGLTRHPPVFRIMRDAVQAESAHAAGDVWRSPLPVSPPEALSEAVVAFAATHVAGLRGDAFARLTLRSRAGEHTWLSPRLWELAIAREGGRPGPDVVLWGVTHLPALSRGQPVGACFSLHLVGSSAPAPETFRQGWLDAFSLQAPPGTGYVVRAATPGPGAGEPDTAPDIVHAFVRSVEEAEEIVSSLAPPRSPRLLVIEDASVPPGSAPPPVDDDAFRRRAAALERALAAGCEAVLWTFEGPPFFHAFYRAILHNKPLDLAAVEGWRPTPRPLPLLAVRPGGEHALLLSRATEERNLRFSGAKRRIGVPKSVSVGPPPDPLAEALSGGLAPHERKRLAAPAVRELLSSLDTARRKALARYDELIGVFSQEMHELYSIALVHDALDVHTGILEVAGDPQKTVEFLDGIEESARRFTHVGIRRRDQGGRDEEIPRDSPLAPGAPYVLHVKIAAGKSGALARFGFPEEAVERLLQQAGELPIDVHVFHEPGDFELDTRVQRLQLPAHGPTLGEATFRFSVPEDADRPVRRLRVALYWKGNLVQSVGLSVPVAPGHGGVVATLDYCATADFADIERWARPAITITTNEAGKSLWFGILKGDRSGLAAYKEELEPARDARDLLLRAGGENNRYRYDADALDPAQVDVDRELAERARWLVTLAASGWQMYSSILGEGAEEKLGRGGDGVAALLSDGASELGGGILQVARCRLKEPTVPWALLYDLPLLVSDPKIHLCPVFLADIRANTWTQPAPGARRRLATIRDKLDSPRSCRARDECPLGSKEDTERRTTVCPFGFWGMRYEIEQPLQAVETEEQAKSMLGVAVQVKRTTAPGAAVLVDRHVQESGVHVDEIKAVLAEANVREASVVEEVDAVRRTLSGPGAAVRYLFGHGQEVKMPLRTFGFRFAAAGQERYIVESDLNVPVKSKDPFLLVLNACESAALLPEHPGVADFLIRFRRLGAAGMIGTETQVHTHLARPFGIELLRAFLAGKTLGAAVLAIRRDMLRQLNPMGLAYTIHGPAMLHLCAGNDQCPICPRPAA